MTVTQLGPYALDRYRGPVPPDPPARIVRTSEAYASEKKLANREIEKISRSGKKRRERKSRVRMDETQRLLRRRLRYRSEHPEPSADYRVRYRKIPKAECTHPDGWAMDGIVDGRQRKKCRNCATRKIEKPMRLGHQPTLGAGCAHTKTRKAGHSRQGVPRLLCCLCGQRRVGGWAGSSESGISVTPNGSRE